MTENVLLRPARVEDAAELTTLTIASKGYWGYDTDFMQKALPYLQVTPYHIETEIVRLVEHAGHIAGYYLLIPHGHELMWMESLFVHPDFIGKGYGGQLLHHAIDLCKSRGYTCMEFESDPNAEPFYIRHGAERIGGRESTVQKGRMLPLMRITL